MVQNHKMESLSEREGWEGTEVLEPRVLQLQLSTFIKRYVLVTFIVNVIVMSSICTVNCTV